jgi:hypothetical protein
MVMKNIAVDFVIVKIVERMHVAYFAGYIHKMANA